MTDDVINRDCMRDESEFVYIDESNVFNVYGDSGHDPLKQVIQEVQNRNVADLKLYWGHARVEEIVSGLSEFERETAYNLILAMEADPDLAAHVMQAYDQYISLHNKGLLETPIGLRISDAFEKASSFGSNKVFGEEKWQAQARLIERMRMERDEAIIQFGHTSLFRILQMDLGYYSTPAINPHTFAYLQSNDLLWLEIDSLGAVFDLFRPAYNARAMEFDKQTGGKDGNMSVRKGLYPLSLNPKYHPNITPKEYIINILRRLKSR